MKKQLLFTIAFLTAISIFAQETVPSTVGTTDLNFSAISPKNETTTTSFGFSGSGGYRQLRDNQSVLPDVATELDAVFDYDLATNDGGSANALLTFQFRVMNDNNGTIEIYIDDVLKGTVNHTALSTGAAGYKALTFTTESLVLSTTPINIKLKFVSVTVGNQVSNQTGLRAYKTVIEVTETLSDNNIDAETAAINLYPNPATDSFQLTSDNITNIAIYSLSGQLVKSFSASNSYDVSNLATGLYSVKVATASGSKTIKLIKK